MRQTAHWTATLAAYVAGWFALVSHHETATLVLGSLGMLGIIAGVVLYWPGEDADEWRERRR